MKTIVIAGAHAHIGKTTLARELCKLLPNSVHIKLGHGQRNPEKDNSYYKIGTPFTKLAEEHREKDYLIIESNRILEEITPHCVIYLPWKDPKPSAVMAEEKADIKRHEFIDNETVERLMAKLAVSKEIISKIIFLAGAKEAAD